MARVATTQGKLRAALAALLTGPTAVDQTAGFFSWFSPETADMLKGVTIDNNGHVIVDLATRQINNASTTSDAGILLSQLNSTVFQFKDAQEIMYQFDGSCEAFYGWLQSYCQTQTRQDWERWTAQWSATGP